MKWYIILAVLLVGYWYITPQQVQVVTQTVIQPAGAAPVPAVGPAPSATNYRQRFALDLAHALGNAQPNEAIMLFIEAWANAENMPESAHNPLATTMPRPNSTCHNWLCVRIYDSDATGLEATVATLKGNYPGYSEIVAGIQQNNPQRALYGLAASPWGTSAQLTMQVYNQMIAQRKAPVVQPVAYKPADNEAPHGNPLNNRATVLTQGYGVGSHAPAAVWGGIDLAIAGGAAATNGTPVFATMGGMVRVSHTWPCGTGIEITHNGYRLLHCHLGTVTVADGSSVAYGQQIGTVGSTGESSGPHLHYEVWKDGVNQNPINYVTR